MTRVRALDGVRGVAIVMVVSHHMLRFRAGFIGVDIFFVLSGYLITTILLGERREAEFWKIFYTRRVVRIVPAFVLLLVLSTITLGVSWNVLWPYLIFFGSNVAAVTEAPLMSTAGLNVLWSLAIEEHFYLIWPFQVRRLSKRALCVFALSVVVASPIARGIAISLGASWMWVYYLTPFRLDGLAMGALLAIVLSTVKGRAFCSHVNGRLLPSSLIAVLLSVPFLDNHTKMLYGDVVGYSLVSLATASVLIHLVFHPGGRISGVLSLRPIVFLGRISYGLYLFHLLVGLVVQHFLVKHGFSNAPRIASVPISILLAWISFHFYESKFSDWGRRRIHRYREESLITDVAT